MGASFYIENFGCRAARADGEAIAARLRAAECCEAELARADVVVVNTCSVTAEADREARAFIRRARRANPAAKIVATGCYAQRAPEELAALEGVAAVVGNSHKALAPEIALGLMRGLKAGSGTAAGSAAGATDALVPVGALLGSNHAGPLVLADDSFAHSFLEEAQVTPGAQTRPNLKIQEGCGNRCSFCVIPQTRGGSRSLAAASVLQQVRGFVAAGGRELVFSGINLGRWGRDFGSGRGSAEIEGWSPTHAAEVRRMDGAHGLESGAHGLTHGLTHGLESGSPGTLARLVRRIFAETELARLRLSSIEPMDWDPELIGLVAEFGGTGLAGSPATGSRRWGRLARHAHLPLQSGSDAVLRRMHRRYRPWHYAEKVAALRAAAGPELTLGADVMVGFPGETDAEFEETLKLVRAMEFGYLHLFPFSPRPGTRAWALHAAAPVAAEAVKERMAALRELAAERTRAHRERMVGRTLDAITLHTPEALAAAGKTSALTENFLPVEMAGEMDFNQLVRVRVMGLTPEGALRAEPVLDEAHAFMPDSSDCCAAVAV